jgi:D-3-phosphoglycerate dehydrogenase
VIAYDKYLEALPDNNAKMVDLYTLYNETQVLSMHIPLTDETRNLTSIEFFNRFEQELVFLNTSRGEIAPLKDILLAIQSNKISMAGLDVLECEKLDEMNEEQEMAFQALKNSGKILFTPHIAGWTQESYQRINAVLVEKIGAFLDRG